MSQFISQYFDINFMADHFSTVFTAFVTLTLELFLISGILSLIWGLILSLLRQVPGKLGAPVRFLSIAYIDVFRGIPLLLVILLIYGGFGALSSSAATPGPLPEFIAIPTFFGKPSAFWYGVFAITITYGAYMAEVYRAGIESVPRGQMEAARSLGMSHTQAMRYVIVPQAVRTVIPPLLNDLVALMKDTSLVSVISPQFVRLRDDKEVGVEETSISQVTDQVKVPDASKSANTTKLNPSKLIERTVYTKVMKENTMVRKLLLWKTNKEDTPDFPAYVVYLTDFSPNRKTPLERDIKVASTEKTAQKLFNEMAEKNFVGGWEKVS